MNNSTEKVKLNDELLDNVAGGISSNMYQNYTCHTYFCNPQYYGCGITFSSDTELDRCIYCRRSGALEEV